MHESVKVLFFLNLSLSALPPMARAQGEVEDALARYNEAFRSKDVAAIHGLLSADVLLYEHSVKNDGREDVFENHLKPEILEFTDVRVTSGVDVALVTRGYALERKYKGKPIEASGNETMVWKKVGAEWKIAHIHDSHPGPRPPESR